MEQINFRPLYKTFTLPCEGEVGDLVVVTPLDEKEFDPSDQGLASAWLCLKESNAEQPALWGRIQFDGVATCAVPTLPEPPQDRPTLREG